MTKTKYKLRPYQEEAVNKLRVGSILLGGVGSGKTFTSLTYFYTKILGGNPNFDEDELPDILDKKDLYVITTARKRDSLDWEREASFFGIGKERDISVGGIKMVVDSWNNIAKYKDVEDAFFIFDEQKVVGSGKWAKTFVKIARANQWILLTATPGDTWMDYVSVFVANGFYKNRTAFIKRHVVFNRFANFPKVDRYVDVERLEAIKKRVIVKMEFERETVPHHIDIIVPHNEEKMERIVKDRWNIYKDEPLVNAGAACYAMRILVNTQPERLEAVRELAEKHKRVIVFYNFDPELELLRTLEDMEAFEVAEYNGHLHQDIPESKNWIYLVQYMAAAEAWNCTDTNVVIFFSLNYSYKLTTQAAGRIDRMNTPFRNLYYYYLRSEASIDLGIQKALRDKTDFNEKTFLRDNKVYF